MKKIKVKVLAYYDICGDYKVIVHLQGCVLNCVSKSN